MDTDVILAISISALTAACCVGFWIIQAIAESKEANGEKEQELEENQELLI